MRPYRYCCKRLLCQGTLKQKIWIFLRLVWEDIESIWLLELPFPTSIKFLLTMLLGIVVLLFLSIPLLIFVFSVISIDHIICPFYAVDWRSSIIYSYLILIYNTFKFGTRKFIGSDRRIPTRKSIILIQDTVLRGILVGNTLATSVDYMHMVRRFINNALP